MFSYLLPTLLLAATASAQTYNASFTIYGSRFGDGNCNCNTVACGYYTYPGYSTAVSQNLYGAGPGQGAGPACGGCWAATANRDINGNPFPDGSTNTIVVKVTNLCPSDGNPPCTFNSSGVNPWGQQVNFDLCDDSGAGEALLAHEPGGPNAGLGTVTMVDCSEWSGTVKYDQGSC